jgi:hypothetical protein
MGFNREINPKGPNKEIAPDDSVKAMIEYMKETYKMTFIGITKAVPGTSPRTYNFRRDDGRHFFYTSQDLKTLGVPVTLSGKYYKDREYKKKLKRENS